MQEMQDNMTIQDYYQLVDAMLKRMATYSYSKTLDFFLCHSFYDDADCLYL